jgi:hypothetical protein
LLCVVRSFVCLLAFVLPFFERAKKKRRNKNKKILHYITKCIQQ